MVVTAKEFLESTGITGQQAETIANWMIQFTQFHVEEALSKAEDAVEYDYSSISSIQKLIRNSYPLENIK